MSNRFVPPDIAERYHVVEARNGLAVLSAACTPEWEDILEVLRGFQLLHTDLAKPGGSKSIMASRLDGALVQRGWIAKRFDTRIVVDGVERASPTHEVDVFKNRVALEVEWNNKDPFFDRDLNNFRLLFDLGVIDVGVIVTRATELQDLLVNEIGRDKQSYGASTTHLDKLTPRLEGGGGGGCPVVVFAIKRENYIDDREPSDG